jgi:SAM-dependent methyltransferase
MPPRDLPKDIASIAQPHEGARLSAPAAQRNVEPLTALLRHHAPTTGRALELASGTGEHALAFARAFPDLTWQPTDLDPERRASIDAWAASEARENLLPAIELDACSPGWGSKHADHALVLLVNLLHLVSEAEARTLIAELPAALAPGGRVILYGPFLRDGETTSDGDARFHAALQAADPETGYKDDFDVIDWLHEAGLELVDVVEMPANNLAFVATRG